MVEDEAEEEWGGEDEDESPRPRFPLLLPLLPLPPLPACPLVVALAAADAAATSSDVHEAASSSCPSPSGTGSKGRLQAENVNVGRWRTVRGESNVANKAGKARRGTAPQRSINQSRTAA